MMIVAIATHNDLQQRHEIKFAVYTMLDGFEGYEFSPHFSYHWTREKVGKQYK